MTKRRWKTTDVDGVEEPVSCEEEEGLRVLAEADLGDVEPDEDISALEQAMRDGANRMIQGGSLPDCVLLSPKAYKELERVVTKDQEVFYDVHTGDVSLRKVK